MQCRQCGQDAEPGAIFCENCGAKLGAEEPAPPQPPPQSTLRCRVCQGPLAADDRFCRACGATVGGTAPAPPAPSPAPSPAAPVPSASPKRGVGLPIVAGVLVIAGALAAYYFFMQAPALPDQAAQSGAAASIEAAGATAGTAPPPSTAQSAPTTPPAPTLGPAPLPGPGTQTAQAARPEQAAQPLQAGAPDQLVVRLIDAPLPPAAYEGWKLSTPPFLHETKEPFDGEVGRVMAHLDQKDRIGGITFTIFRTPADALPSFDERNRLGPNPPPSLVNSIQRFSTRRGAPVWCLIGQCNALVGRVHIYVRLEGSPFEASAAIVESLAVHVARFDR